AGQGGRHRRGAGVDYRLAAGHQAVPRNSRHVRPRGAGGDVSVMEVVIGFAVGYWVGTRQGRQGLQNALESAQAIWARPETRKMLAEGISAAQTVAGPVMERLGDKSSRSRRAALISSVVDELIERRQARRGERRDHRGRRDDARVDNLRRRTG